jgi:hypothetical protein
MVSAATWSPPEPSQLRAAPEIVAAVIQEMKDGRGVHAETAIAAVARIGGTFLFRDFNFPLTSAKPGEAVLSDAANEFGPQLVQTLGATLSALKVSFHPGAQIPDEHKPHWTVSETQTRLEASVVAITNRHRLTRRQSAHACAVAAAGLIHQCSAVLHPSIGFSLAAYGFVEGSKTMPVPLNEAPKGPGPWYRFWK